MKKLMTILGAFLFASVVLTSCGGGVEADAEKTCEMMCEGMDLMKKATEEYRKFQANNLSPVENEYLMHLKSVEKEVKRKKS